MTRGRVLKGVLHVGGRQKIRAGLFWQLAETKPGDTFDYQDAEFTVDNVVACPAGGYEVSAHPSAIFRSNLDGERLE